MANWYPLFNLVEFMDTGLTSRTLVLQLQNRGTKIFEIFRGNSVSIQYADGFLPINFLDQNPYVQGNYAVYLDGDDMVWFGFAEGAT